MMKNFSAQNVEKSSENSLYLQNTYLKTAENVISRSAHALKPKVENSLCGGEFVEPCDALQVQIILLVEKDNEFSTGC